MSPARALGPLLAVLGIVAASCSSPHATSSTAPSVGGWEAVSGVLAVDDVLGQRADGGLTK